MGHRGTEAPEGRWLSATTVDAWVYCAVDPDSGTAAMLETAHGFGELLKTVAAGSEL